MSHKHTIEFLRNEFAKRGCTLTDTNYKDAHTKLHYIASCGHPGYMNWCNFSHGSGTICPKCADTKKTYENVKAEFERRGCKLLSEKYVGAFSKLEYIAACGHKHSVAWSNFQQGFGTLCPRCSNLKTAEQNRIPFEDIKKLFESRGCKLLSVERRTANDKLKYIAACGHETATDYMHFRAGNGTVCPNCAFRNLSEKFVGEVVKDMFPDIETQHRIYDGLGGVLRLDFFSPSKRIGIEYNGRQHYESVEYFGGDQRLLTQQKRDERKKSFCVANNIQLISIDGRKIDCRKSTKEEVRSWIEEQIRCGITS